MLVGRDQELQRLRALRDTALAGSTTVVLIAGEAGVGKTDLITNFIRGTVRDNTSARVVQGACVPLGDEGLPYAPLVDLLHDLAQQIGEAKLFEFAGVGVAELRWLVPEFGAVDPSADLDRPESQLRLFETFIRLLERTSRESPLIIVIEDLHWADQSSRHLIEMLIRMIADVPALIMISYRTDELTRMHPLRLLVAELARVPRVHRIDVGPLSDAAMQILIRQNLAASDQVDASRDAQLIKKLSETSGGIPYFLIELIRARQSGGQLPQTLRDTLLTRIAQVGEACQRLLRLIAVGGNRVEHSVIAAVSDLQPDDLEQLLREANDANLVIADKSGYRFRHALMREVVYDDLLPGERVRMHRTFAETLDSHPELMAESVRAVELAHHASAASDNVAAFHWSVRAARLQRYGYAEALRHYERAIMLWDVVEHPEAIAGPLTDLLDEASEAANAAGDVERSLALINAALRAAGPDADPEPTALRLARKARRLHNLVRPGVLELAEQAVDLVPADRSSGFRARLLDYQAAIQLMLDKPAAVASAREAIEVAQAVRDRDIESSARNTLGCALVTLGIDVEGGLRQLQTAGELAVEDQTRIRYFVNYSDTLNLIGRHSEAVEIALRGRELAADVGRDKLIGVMMTANAAEALLAEGDWLAARELVESNTYVDTSAVHWIQNRRLLAIISLWMDDNFESAEEILGDLSRYTQTMNAGRQYRVGIQLARAELALARNRPHEAWDGVQSLVEALDWPEPGYDLMLLAIGAAAYGRSQDRASTWAAWLTDQVHTLLPFPAAGKWLPFIEAELDGTPDRWQAAVEEMTHARTPPHMIVYGYLRLAEHEAAAGLRDRSERSVRAGRALAIRLGLRLPQRWFDEFTRGKVDLGLSDVDDSPISTLTPRELEVLALLAEGLSNKQIGDRLVIATKTVSVHVTNILAKLNVSNRLAAARRFRPTSR